MSSDCFVAYIGLRYEVEAGEITELELRRDPRQLAARSVGLKTYWGNFGGAVDRYVLLIGAELAILGSENVPHIQLSPERLSAIFSDTKKQLEKAGLPNHATLNLEFSADI